MPVRPAARRYGSNMIKTAGIGSAPSPARGEGSRPRRAAHSAWMFVPRPSQNRPRKLCGIEWCQILKAGRGSGQTSVATRRPVAQVDPEAQEGAYSQERKLGKRREREAEVRTGAKAYSRATDEVWITDGTTTGGCDLDERVASELVAGERASGERASGERASGERASGEHVSDEHVSRGRDSGERGLGKRGTGKRDKSHAYRLTRHR